MTTKCIRVNSDTYNRLAELGNLSDTFEIVIKRLLDENAITLKLAKQMEKGFIGKKGGNKKK